MNTTELRNLLAFAASRARREKALVGSITNTVTVNFVANAQLAIGGSAAMVYMPDEGEALAKAAAAIYINMGTIMPVYEESVPLTARTAHELHKPWVLDPVGVGIGGLRAKILQQLKEYKPSIIRGNASEIIALGGLWGVSAAKPTVAGVDAKDDVEDAKVAAIALACLTGGAVAVSGPVDLITNGKALVHCKGGSELMPRITGGGCALGGVMAVYAAAVPERPAIAAMAASALFKIAAHRGEKRAIGTGTFFAHFMDELGLTTPDSISAYPFDWEEVAQ